MDTLPSVDLETRVEGLPNSPDGLPNMACPSGSAQCNEVQGEIMLLKSGRLMTVMRYIPSIVGCAHADTAIGTQQYCSGTHVYSAELACAYIVLDAFTEAMAPRGHGVYFGGR